MFGGAHDFVLTQAQARGLASDEMDDYRKRLTNFQLKNLMNHSLNKTETDEFKYINSLNDFEDKKRKKFNKLKNEY
jgi:ribonucleotide reductase beta subunit family protein with ferritin-like domain